MLELQQALLKKNSVLAVDDNASNLILLHEILRNIYKVYTAPTGERALAFLEKNIPDIILLDIEMPGMSGYQLISKLKTDPRWEQIPVIFLTANEGLEGETQAFELGAVDYIRKPISEGVVKARLRLHLELELYRKYLENVVEQRTLKLKKTEDAILDILANITAFRDNETGGHIKRTTNYVALIVNHLLTLKIPGYNFYNNHGEFIIKSTKLHDIGKVAVPDLILLKPGRLTPEEFDIIKLHTEYGAQMIDDAIKDLEDDSFLTVAKEIVISHHEWWNGKGYPYGKQGTEIPISGRIMAIADVYDALISKRPYKDPMTHDEAVEVIYSEYGTHFDPVLMDICKDVIAGFAAVADAYKD